MDKEHQDQLPKFLCEMCVVEFPTKEDMKSHKLEKHTTQLTNRGRMYTCSLCDFKTTDANWNKVKLKFFATSTILRNNVL